MDIKNLLAIIVILVAVVGIVIFYIRQLKKNPDDIEYESVYSLEYLKKGVAQVFADTQKANLKEQNLSKRELEAEQRKKLELRRNLKTAAFGDSTAKKYIKSLIKEILQSKRFNINEETIDLVIPFHRESALDTRNKTDIILYLYFKNYGAEGFKHLMHDYKLNEPKQGVDEISGGLLYEVTKEDIDRVFADIHGRVRLSYEDKLEIVAQRIFSDYKGFGVVDMLTEFAIDEIDCGVSGVPQGTYELKKHMLTKDFEYSYNSIWVVFSGINYKLSCMTFGKQEELVRVCQNIYKYAAPYALSRKKGKVVGTMKDGSRIAVARPPVAESWEFFLRKFDSVASASPYDLVKNPGKEIPLCLSKWITKAAQSVGVTGSMGAGKTTWLRAMLGGFLPSTKNLRVYELAYELNLQFAYPKRNIATMAVTESIGMQELYDFGKKTNANVSVISECATPEMGVIVIHSATVGSEAAYFTHHAKTAEDMVLSLRDNLTTVGGYSSEKVAEEVVSKAINFNIHWERTEKGERYIQRITEIVPNSDNRYPCEKESSDGVFSKKDTLEYYKRSTNPQCFTVRNIVEFKNGRYEMVNPISDARLEDIKNHLSKEDEELFMKDYETLLKTMEHKAS